MSDERHADYPMYRAAVTGLEAEVKSRHLHFTDHAELERAAGQLVVEAKAAGLPTIARVAAIDGGKAIFAMDRDPGDANAAAARRIYVDREQAISHSVAESTQRVSQLDNDLAQALKPPERDTAIAAR
jgi:putative chitinase